MQSEKIHGFKTIGRILPEAEAPQSRIRHYQEFYQPYSADQVHGQSARCMDCGVPFCHSACPLGNAIPEFNDAVYHERWQEAYSLLATTNNFPEFTGRICPAPCESACVLAIHRPAVAIEAIEKHIIEMAFEKGWVKPYVPEKRTGKKVAIIGSGPAGLAAADELNAMGHHVTVMERDDAAGGLLRYGIPDFKLEKNIIDRRIHIMENSGIVFKYHCYVGGNVFMQDLLDQYDAVILATGAMVPNDVPLEGRHLTNVHFAMDFLKQQNKINAGREAIYLDEAESNRVGRPINAHNKRVVIIGSGDTGSDCIGTSIRQGAKSVTQIARMHRPGEERPAFTPWPLYPEIHRTSSSQEEGCERLFSTITKAFLDDGKGAVSGVLLADLHWELNAEGKRLRSTEMPGSERVLPCDLVLIATGFAGPDVSDFNHWGIQVNASGHVLASDADYLTSHPRIFACGDNRRGQSLVVWAIAEGRECARAVGGYLG